MSSEAWHRPARRRHGDDDHRRRIVTDARVGEGLVDAHKRLVGDQQCRRQRQEMPCRRRSRAGDHETTGLRSLIRHVSGLVAHDPPRGSEAWRTVCKHAGNQRRSSMRSNLYGSGDVQGHPCIKGSHGLRCRHESVGIRRRLAGYSDDHDDDSQSRESGVVTPTACAIDGLAGRYTPHLGARTPAGSRRQRSRVLPASRRRQDRKDCTDASIIEHLRLDRTDPIGVTTRCRLACGARRRCSGNRHHETMTRSPGRTTHRISTAARGASRIIHA